MEFEDCEGVGGLKEFGDAVKDKDALKVFDAVLEGEAPTVSEGVEEGVLEEESVEVE